MASTGRFVWGVARLLMAGSVLPWLVQSGCRSNSPILGPDSWEVVYADPTGPMFQMTEAPDGTLFAAGRSGVFRSIDGSPGSWKRIGGESLGIVRLFALGGDTVFAVLSACGGLMKWSAVEGWSRLALDESGAGASTLNAVPCRTLLDVWARSGRDIYVVGLGGYVAHYDGTRWMSERIASATDSILADEVVWSVSGDTAAIYAAIGSHFARRSLAGARWTLLKLGGVESKSCAGTAVAAVDSGAFFADSYCLTFMDSSSIRVIEANRYDWRGELYRGARQVDGTALFWSYNGVVCEVRRSQVRMTHLVGIRAVGSVVRRGGYLYVSGTTNAGGLIVRVRL
jgi:hypothetical protein